jgi:hypothetical protein
MLFLFISMILFSCKTIKENNAENITSNEKMFEVTDTIIDTIDLVLVDSDNDGFVDSLDKCPFDYGVDNGCPKISPMEIEKEKNDFIKISEEQKVVNRIEKHEKQTKLKVIDRSTSDTTRGWIAYSIPKEMKVAKSYSVKVRISKKINGQNKSDLILGSQDAINNKSLPSIATIEDVKVSGEMLAELRGDVDAFDIKALSTEVQNIDNESYTEWEWVVTPKKSGYSPLKLVIKVKELNKDIVVFNKDIQVQKNVTVAVEGFFDKYWQWLMTTIIIPIFIYFWNKKKKKQKKS